MYQMTKLLSKGLIKRKISYKIITDINEINKIEKSYNEMIRQIVLSPKTYFRVWVF